MGIKGLMSFLTRAGYHGEKVDLSQEPEATAGLVFDGNNLLYRLYHFAPDFGLGHGVSFVHGGQYLHFYHVCRAFFTAFLAKGIPCHVVFDGLRMPSKHAAAADAAGVGRFASVPSSHRNVELVEALTCGRPLPEWLIRLLDRAGGQENASVLDEMVKNSLAAMVPTFGYQVMLEALNDLKLETAAVRRVRDGGPMISVSVAPGEADPEVVKVCHRLGAFGVCALDTDYVALLSDLCDPSLSQAVTGQTGRYISLQHLNFSSDGGIAATILDSSVIARDLLHIQPAQLPHFACLVGNDYLNPDVHLATFLSRIGAVRFADRVPCVAAFLNDKKDSGDVVAVNPAEVFSGDPVTVQESWAGLLEDSVRTYKVLSAEEPASVQKHHALVEGLCEKYPWFSELYSSSHFGSTFAAVMVNGVESRAPSGSSGVVGNHAVPLQALATLKPLRIAAWSAVEGLTSCVTSESCHADEMGEKQLMSTLIERMASTLPEAAGPLLSAVLDATSGQGLARQDVFVLLSISYSLLSDTWQSWSDTHLKPVEQEERMIQMVHSMVLALLLKRGRSGSTEWTHLLRPLDRRLGDRAKNDGWLRTSVIRMVSTVATVCDLTDVFAKAICIEAATKCSDMSVASQLDLKYQDILDGRLIVAVDEYLRQGHAAIDVLAQPDEEVLLTEIMSKLQACVLVGTPDLARASSIASLDSGSDASPGAWIAGALAELDDGDADDELANDGASEDAGEGADHSAAADCSDIYSRIQPSQGLKPAGSIDLRGSIWHELLDQPDVKVNTTDAMLASGQIDPVLLIPQFLVCSATHQKSSGFNFFVGVIDEIESRSKLVVQVFSDPTELKVGGDKASKIMLVCDRIDDEFFPLGVGVRFKARGVKGVHVTHEADRHIRISVHSIELIGSRNSSDVNLWNDLWGRAKRRMAGQVAPVSISAGVQVPWARVMRSHFNMQPQPWQTAAFAAIEAEENNRCVFVTAPTGAGKTQVAMCAVASILSLQDPSACLIYVAPTKALANQLFIDVLSTVTKSYPQEPGHIRTHVEQLLGINTAESKLHTSAQIIITVPKTLLTWLSGVGTRNYLERVQKIVLDEAHHIQDSQDGRDWEQIVMLVPPQIQLILLSATVSRPVEFVSWLKAVADELDAETERVETETHVVEKAGKFVHVNVPSSQRPVKQKFYTFSGKQLKKVNTHAFFQEEAKIADLPLEATDREEDDATRRKVEIALAFTDEVRRLGGETAAASPPSASPPSAVPPAPVAPDAPASAAAPDRVAETAAAMVAWMRDTSGCPAAAGADTMAADAASRKSAPTGMAAATAAAAADAAAPIVRRLQSSRPSLSNPAAVNEGDVHIRIAQVTLQEMSFAGCTARSHIQAALAAGLNPNNGSGTDVLPVVASPDPSSRSPHCSASERVEFQRRLLLSFGKSVNVLDFESLHAAMSDQMYADQGEQRLEVQSKLSVKKGPAEEEFLDLVGASLLWNVKIRLYFAAGSHHDCEIQAPGLQNENEAAVLHVGYLGGGCFVSLSDSFASCNSLLSDLLNCCALVAKNRHPEIFFKRTAVKTAELLEVTLSEPSLATLQHSLIMCMLADSTLLLLGLVLDEARVLRHEVVLAILVGLPAGFLSPSDENRLFHTSSQFFTASMPAVLESLSERPDLAILMVLHGGGVDVTATLQALAKQQAATLEPAHACRFAAKAMIHLKIMKLPGLEDLDSFDDIVHLACTTAGYTALSSLFLRICTALAVSIDHNLVSACVAAMLASAQKRDWFAACYSAFEIAQIGTPNHDLQQRLLLDLLRSGDDDARMATLGAIRLSHHPSHQFVMKPVQEALLAESFQPDQAIDCFAALSGAGFQIDVSAEDHKVLVSRASNTTPIACQMALLGFDVMDMYRACSMYCDPAHREMTFSVILHIINTEQVCASLFKQAVDFKVLNTVVPAALFELFHADAGAAEALLLSLLQPSSGLTHDKALTLARSSELKITIHSGIESSRRKLCEASLRLSWNSVVSSRLKAAMLMALHALFIGSPRHAPQTLAGSLDELALIDFEHCRSWLHSSSNLEELFGYFCHFEVDQEDLPNVNGHTLEPEEAVTRLLHCIQQLQLHESSRSITSNEERIVCILLDLVCEHRGSGINTLATELHVEWCGARQFSHSTSLQRLAVKLAVDCGLGPVDVNVAFTSRSATFLQWRLMMELGGAFHASQQSLSKDEYFTSLVQALAKQNALPALMFSNNVQEVNNVAAYLLSQHETLGFGTHGAATSRAIAQSKEILSLTSNALAGNAQEDAMMLSLLDHGIGIHHRQLSRTWKMEVESLFRAGHLQIVCCTQTLAVGVHMPARSVVLMSDDQKYVNRAKMYQMAGRAGRPGHNRQGGVGNVIFCGFSKGRMTRLLFEEDDVSQTAPSLDIKYMLTLLAKANQASSLREQAADLELESEGVTGGFTPEAAAQVLTDTASQLVAQVHHSLKDLRYVHQKNVKRRSAHIQQFSRSAIKTLRVLGMIDQNLSPTIPAVVCTGLQLLRSPEDLLLVDLMPTIASCVEQRAASCDPRSEDAGAQALLQILLRFYPPPRHFNARDLQDETLNAQVKCMTLQPLEPALKNRLDAFNALVINEMFMEQEPQVEDLAVVEEDAGVAELQCEEDDDSGPDDWEDEEDDGSPDINGAQQAAAAHRLGTLGSGGLRVRARVPSDLVDPAVQALSGHAQGWVEAPHWIWLKYVENIRPELFPLASLSKDLIKSHVFDVLFSSSSMSYLDLEMRWKVRRADLDSDLNDALQFIKRLRSSLDGVSLLIKSDDDLRDAGLDPSFQGPSWLSESQHRVLICELDRLVELLTMRIEDGVERTGGLRNPQFTARCVSWNIRRGTGELAVQATAGGEHRVEVSWQSIVGLAKSLAVNEIVKCQIFEDIDGTSEAVNVVSAGGFRLEGIVSGRSILYKSEGWAGQDLRFSLPFGDNSGVVSGQSVRFAASYRLRQGTILAYVAVDLDWDDMPVERGRCRWWNADKGMGHIKPDVPHGRGDLFCFASEICVDEFAPVVNPASQSMQPGDIVDFVRRCQPERDTDKAVAIKRIGAGRPLPQLARKLPPRR